MAGKARNETRIEMKSTNTSRSLKLLGILTCALLVRHAQAQLLVDDLNRPDGNTVGNGWVEYETLPPGSASISGGALQLKSNITGRDFVSRQTPGAYETTLSNNSCMLEWSFHMRQNALNPTGFGTGATGMAVVLAGSHEDLLQGQGYAVVLGTNGSSINPLRLVRYTNGLDANNNITNLISFGNFNNQALAVRVTFDPTTGTWEMFQASGSTWPSMESATNSAGTAVDTWYTNTPLPYIGCLWNHGTVNSTRALFDNISVPFDCSSRVDFSAASGTVNSFAGSVQIPLEMVHPHMSAPAEVSVSLIGGEPAAIGGWAAGSVIFPGGSTAAMLELSIPVDGGCPGDRQLLFEITGITGGSGTPFIGPSNKYLLTIVDDRSGMVQLLDESFETDGNGVRYTMNAAHANPASGSYFLRGTSTTFNGAGGIPMSAVHGSSYVGMSNMATIAPNAEAVISFPSMDIIGMQQISINLMAGARNAALFDQAFAQRDYLLVETNIDGTGWATVGAFRSHKENPYVDGWLRQDTNLDGVGDGATLGQSFQDFIFPVPVHGASLQLRIRTRSTEALEDIFIDRVQVRGDRCRPYYFSMGSGTENDAIWSPTLNGSAQAISIDRYTTLVVRDGHTISASGSGRVMQELIVEENGMVQLESANWDVRGERITNDGSITSTTGRLRLVSSAGITMAGNGTYDLFDMHVNSVNGTTLEPLTLDVRGTLQIENGAFDATAADVRLRSTAAGTGRLGPVEPGSSYLGNMTVERYIPAGATNWRFLAAPVSAATVQDWQDDFFTAGYPGSHYPNFYSNGELWPSIRWYDETAPGADQNDGLTGVTASQVLQPGQGFAAWCGTSLNTTTAFTVEVAGAPNIATSPITLPMTYTNTGNAGTDGFNLVSNPLPSPIAFSQIQRGADVGNFYWIYDPATGTNATWNGIVGTNGANGIIQSSQSFWLKATGPDMTTTIGEDAKVAGNSGGFFGNFINGLPMLRLKVSDQGGQFSDEAVVVFEHGLPGVDELDVPKMTFTHIGAPLISTWDTEENNLSINMYGMPSEAISIPVEVQVGISGLHVIQASQLEVIAGLSCIMLEDLHENVMIPLNNGESYTFHMDPGTSPGPRFMLHLSSPISRTIQDITCHGLSNGAVSMVMPNGPAEVVLMDVFSTVINGQYGQSVTFADLEAGNYMISVDSDAGCGALTGAFTIAEPMPIEVEFMTTQAACGEANGTLVSEVFGGVAPYTLTWSDGSSLATLTAAAGEYSLHVVDANGCEMTTAVQSIGQAAPPTSAFEMSSNEVMPYETVHFTNTSVAADEYIWDMGDGAMLSGISFGYMYGVPGVYTVTLTAIRGMCETSSSQQVFVGEATSVAEHAMGDLNIWHDGSDIQVMHGIDNGQNVVVEVLDATGRLHITANGAGTPGTIRIPAAQLTAGIWFVRLSNGNDQHTGRVIITR